MAITNFNHRVDWIEFTERISRAAGVDENAKIKLDMGYSYDMTKSDGEWTVTNLKVELAVKKAESWIVKGTKTEKLRNHEQGHYDITALGYRDMYNEVKVLKRKSMSALKAKIKKVKKKKQADINTKNKLYDSQTDHGTIPGSQIKWDKNIRGEMENEKGSLSNLV